MEDLLSAAAVANRSTSGSSSELARRTLEQTKHDVENEHLEIEGVIGDGGHGTVYWGTWRGLEVAIKTVAFQVQHPRLSLGLSTCVCLGNMDRFAQHRRL